MGQPSLPLCPILALLTRSSTLPTVSRGPRTKPNRKGLNDCSWKGVQHPGLVCLHCRNGAGLWDCRRTCCSLHCVPGTAPLVLFFVAQHTVIQLKRYHIFLNFLQLFIAFACREWMIHTLQNCSMWQENSMPSETSTVSIITCPSLMATSNTILFCCSK